MTVARERSKLSQFKPHNRPLANTGDATVIDAASLSHEGNLTSPRQVHSLKTKFDKQQADMSSLTVKEQAFIINKDRRRNDYLQKFIDHIGERQAEVALLEERDAEAEALYFAQFRKDQLQVIPDNKRFQQQWEAEGKRKHAINMEKRHQQMQYNSMLLKYVLNRR